MNYITSKNHKYVLNEINKFSEMKKLSYERKQRLNVYINQIRKSEKLVIREKFNKWRGNQNFNCSSDKSLNFIEQSFIFAKITNRASDVIDSHIAKIFFKNAARKANWINPKQKVTSSYTKGKIITYFLKDGSIKTVKRERKVVNYLKKYMSPLKYYFNKYKNNVGRKIEREYEKISKKWVIKNNDEL